jgi:hypothetical protein
MEQTVLAVESTPIWENVAHAVFRLIGMYGWHVAAVLVAPLLSFVAVQHYKAANRRFFGRKPIAPLLDAVAWLIVLVLSFRFWTLADLSREASIYAALTVACFHTGIVKFVFAHAPKPVQSVLAQSAFPNGDGLTAVGLTRTILLGRAVEQRKHDQPVPVERRKHHAEKEDQTETKKG